MPKTNKLPDLKKKEGIEILRHSTAHLLAHAVKRLFPEAKPTIGPVIEEGFYYDFDFRPFTPDDLPKIEAEMQKIANEKLQIERIELSKTEAKKIFKDNKYKIELINEMEEGKITAYKQGDFIDLCRGPHLPNTSYIKAFKLTKIAGAYWRGDEKNPQLQRIYGISFPDKKQLDDYIEFLKEVEKRDHLKLGKELELFSLHEEVGAGLVHWHPRGAIIRKLIEDFWFEEHKKRGYKYVYTPHIGNIGLWKKSGHWDFYRESMYSPMKIDSAEYLIKPMNCPFHVMVYSSRIHSYKELPLKYCELGTVYRYEKSGVLHGLVRVRGFTQDDSHIFCEPEQLESAISDVLDLAFFMLKTFGFDKYKIELSVRDPQHKEKYLGSEEVWSKAENALKKALEKKKIRYDLGIGEAKFYGPAIDIKLFDALGRAWQGPTIQVDFNFPEKFELTYEGRDGKKHTPVMIHRTVLGSMERFLGCLIEHYAGKFPVWLNPTQIRILPVADRHIDYAKNIAEKMISLGLRVEIDERSEGIPKKVRDAQLMQVNYILVVGDKEKSNGTVNVRTRDNVVHGEKKVDDFIKDVLKEVMEKR